MLEMRSMVNNWWRIALEAELSSEDREFLRTLYLYSLPIQGNSVQPTHEVDDHP
jgi:hypothetical protein